MSQDKQQLQQIGEQLVALCNEGKDDEVVARFYADNIVSIEDNGTDEAPARIEGIDALRAKHAWWNSNVEMHSAQAEGPFIGLREDQFAVRFSMDATMPEAGRVQATEMALYTLSDGKIVQEEFLPLAS